MGDGAHGGGPRDDVSGLRTILLAVVVFGVVGLGAELVLLEHWGSWVQGLPLVALAAGLGVTLAAWLRPARRTLRALQGVMAAFLVLGLVGLWLHYRGNVLFEREMDAAVGGWTLVRYALFGGVPVLAPGALMQIGLVGLAATFRHPALRTPSPGAAAGAPEDDDGSDTKRRDRDDAPPARSPRPASPAGGST